MSLYHNGIVMYLLAPKKKKKKHLQLYLNKL